MGFQSKNKTSSHESKVLRKKRCIRALHRLIDGNSDFNYNISIVLLVVNTSTSASRWLTTELATWKIIKTNSSACFRAITILHSVLLQAPILNTLQLSVEPFLNLSTDFEEPKKIPQEIITSYIEWISRKAYLLRQFSPFLDGNWSPKRYLNTKDCKTTEFLSTSSILELIEAGSELCELAISLLGCFGQCVETEVLLPGVSLVLDDAWGLFALIVSIVRVHYKPRDANKLKVSSPFAPKPVECQFHLFFDRFTDFCQFGKALSEDLPALFRVVVPSKSIRCILSGDSDALDAAALLPVPDPVGESSTAHQEPGTVSWRTFMRSPYADTPSCCNIDNTDGESEGYYYESNENDECCDEKMKVVSSSLKNPNDFSDNRMSNYNVNNNSIMLMNSANHNGYYVQPPMMYCEKWDWEIEPNEIVPHRKIGEGATATVFQGTWHGTEVAVKKFENMNIVSQTSLSQFKHELRILLRLRHPNLVLFMGASFNPFLMVTEFCAGGNLFDILHQTTITLTWQQKLKLATDIAKGCAYLHASQIIHRDLKSLNILLSQPLTSPLEVPLVKVADFGLSLVGRTIGGWPAVGTYHWMAPEVFNERTYNEKADIYSYGILLYEIITCKTPYEEIPTCIDDPASIGVAASQGIRPSTQFLPSSCPLAFRQLMEACWSQTPELRPSFRRILMALEVVKKEIEDRGQAPSFPEI